jgi:glycerophosphoryl diester phosphodiesterase
MGRALLPAVIGHRGAAAAAPENTLEAIAEAAAEGAGMVELDVKLTADGALILMHDDRLERTTSGRGAVAETPLAAIRALDAGAWFGPAWQGAQVPTFEMAVELLASRGLDANVEIKPCPGREVETAAAVAGSLKRCWPAERGWPLLTSFARESLATVRDLAPDLPRGLLLWGKPRDWSWAARDLGCRTVHCAAGDMTPEWAAEIRRLGYGLAVYTVNDPAAAAELRGWGVEGIITDSPRALIQAT